ncbi:Sec-independent protein translocase protein TatB [Asticcacaulis taihuensis]|uniref:Sec-independent protein translocase protein TatB n=1 Tax=Asticcacaulis taihuensis TaxID=260084 RepID=UPI0026ECB9D4|nr:Sec-independent protein translocase protein TatB [Asticcacaulis taihuensis]
MVPGIGGGELILIAVVALVVVGPKDLPKLLRQLGRFVGKMRRMADEFRTSFEDMARQSELDDLRKEVDALRAGKLGLEDVGHQMKALESDISSSLTAPTPEYKPASYAPEAADEPVNPQLDGLPPVEKSETPAKPKRVRKAKAAAAPEPEPTVTPVKRTRTKKSAQ